VQQNKIFFAVSFLSSLLKFLSKTLPPCPVIVRVKNKGKGPSLIQRHKPQTAAALLCHRQSRREAYRL